MANYASGYVDGFQDGCVKASASVNKICNAVLEFGSDGPSDLVGLRAIARQVLAETALAMHQMPMDPVLNAGPPGVAVPAHDRAVPVWNCPDA